MLLGVFQEQIETEVNVNSQTETLQTTSLQAPQVLFLKQYCHAVCLSANLW